MATMDQLQQDNLSAILVCTNIWYGYGERICLNVTIVFNTLVQECNTQT